jgi:hypothetical protein
MITETRQRHPLRIVRDHRLAHSGGTAKQDLGWPDPAVIVTGR